MCDAYSLASAGADLGTGIAGSIDARSSADFEAAQLDAMKTLAAARGSEEEVKLRRDYAEHAGMNLAAAAITGLTGPTFSAIAEGNEKDLQGNLGRIARGVKLEQLNLDMQKREALMQGKTRARAALFGGINRALGTIHDAEKTYQEVNTGETRIESLVRSIGLNKT